MIESRLKISNKIKDGKMVKVKEAPFYETDTDIV